MKTLNELLDAARKQCDRDSDAAIAERLKVSRNTMMQWRRGTVRITDDHLVALIQLAQADQAALLKVREEMAGSPAERKTWRSLLDRMGAAAVVVAVGAAVIALAHPGAHEMLQAGLPLLAVNSSFYTLCEIADGPSYGPLRWIWLWIKTYLPPVADPHRLASTRAQRPPLTPAGPRTACPS